jgi:fructose-specific phosphotransferase system component IIB
MHQVALSLWSKTEVQNHISEPEISKQENVIAWTHLRMNEERFAKKVLTIEINRKHP